MIRYLHRDKMQRCESGMNCSGAGYDVLRVSDPGKVPDPTGSDPKYLKHVRKF